MLQIHLLVFILIFFFRDSLSLQMTRVVIPSPVQVGSRTMLSCFFELDWGESVYTVNWYRNSKEFFRFSPSESPPSQTFNRAGIFVDTRYSNMTTVTLKYVSLSTSGIYRCEIATEAPAYFTIHAQRSLQVVDLPRRGPLISGVQNVYKPGDLVQLNCTSARSKPAAALAWYINDRRADDNLVKDFPIELHRDGLETSRIALSFRLATDHVYGEMRLQIKCTAEIAALYWKTHAQHIRIHLPTTDTRVSGGSECTALSATVLVLVLVAGLCFEYR